MSEQFTMRPISARINVSRIDKSRLFKGEQGSYLDLFIIPTDPGRYGDNFMVVQPVSKEERERGESGPILGNGRFMGREKTITLADARPNSGSTSNTAGSTASQDEDDGDDIPF